MLAGTYNDEMSGTGAVNVSPIGTVVFANANSYSGLTSLTGAGATILQLNEGAPVGNVVTTNAANILNFNDTAPVTYAGVISGPGGVGIGSGVLSAVRFYWCEYIYRSNNTYYCWHTINRYNEYYSCSWRSGFRRSGE